MSMQVCYVDPQPQPQQPPMPTTDLQKMKAELDKMNTLLQDIETGKATKDTFASLKTSVLVTNEIIIFVDNANDFFKIGGFNKLKPLLSCTDEDVVAAAAELVADLCQNNKFCQSKLLDINIMPELVQLMDLHPNATVCLKALYALSCLCRNNDETIKYVEVTNFLPVLMRLLQKPDERLSAKAAFFLSSLTKYETLRETLYQADMVGILIRLIKDRNDLSSEHLLCALLHQVNHHKQSRIQCRKEEYNVKELLQTKLQFYESKSEYIECKEHCSKLLNVLHI